MEKFLLFIMFLCLIYGILLIMCAFLYNPFMIWFKKTEYIEYKYILDKYFNLSMFILFLISIIISCYVVFS